MCLEGSSITWSIKKIVLVTWGKLSECWGNKGASTSVLNVEVRMWLSLWRECGIYHGGYRSQRNGCINCSRC